MEGNKQCTRDVLAQELDDLKVMARLMKKAYQEDTEKCEQSIEEIVMLNGYTVDNCLN